jgi:hypothetical protein
VTIASLADQLVADSGGHTAFAARTIMQTIEFGRAGYAVNDVLRFHFDDAKCRVSMAAALARKVAA